MQTESAWQIKQEQFEGPIEVLLELIEKRKLFVNDISLAAVTDDFISYIQTKGMHPDLVAHFLSVAATLILIKAKSLLPTIELTSEESASVSDLERRLALYQLISEVAVILTKEYGKKISFGGIERQGGPVFAPSGTLGPAQLLTLAHSTLNTVPPPPSKAPEARVYKTISLSEVLSTLSDRIQHALTTSFNAIAVLSPDADPKSQKVYRVVSFLGMLELVRRGFIQAEQEKLFADITLQKQAVEPTLENADLSYE